MVNIAVRYFQCVLDLVKFVRREYEALYDETRLASEFTIENIESLHEDMIQLLGSSLSRLPFTSHRVDGSKLLITSFVNIFTELEKEKFQQHCSEHYSKFYTQKFKRSTAQKSAKKVKKTVETSLMFQKEIDYVIHTLDVLLQNVPASKMIDIAGDLMCCQTFAPLGVHIVTHLQHVIKFDPEASLDDLFTKQMPMSSLKTLIKFMFKSHDVELEKIKKLFQKSSIDGRVCILQHFYQRAIEQDTIRELFLQLLSQVCKKNVEVFVTFFDAVYSNADSKEFNTMILDAVKPIIDTEKMNPQMLSFMGYLEYPCTVPYQRAEQCLHEIGGTNKESPYILAYMLDRYPDHYSEIEGIVVDCVFKKVAAGEESETANDANFEDSNSCTDSDCDSVGYQKTGYLKTENCLAKSLC